MPDENKRKTKECPFCAETILAAAVKCRFCSEFLYPKGHPRLNEIPDHDEDYDEDEYEEDEYEEEYEEEAEQQEDDILFRARPSTFAAIGTLIKCLIFLGLGIALYNVQIEQYISDFSDGRFEFTNSQSTTFGDYRIIAAVVVGILAVLFFVLKVIIIKSTAYEVTADRIEWERGLLNRKIDNVDMFRVVDLKLHRSILDCMIGIGTVTLFTKDETDPEFELYKVRNPRKIFDILKKASLEADRNQGVIHLE